MESGGERQAAVAGLSAPESLLKIRYIDTLST